MEVGKDSSVIWLAENPPIPLSPYTTDRKLDDCGDYEATNICCDTSKEVRFITLNNYISSTVLYFI